MEAIFINTRNSKTNELHKFVLTLSPRLKLRSSNEYVARKQYKSNKLKIIAPTWDDEFKLPDGSYSLTYSRLH